MALWLTLAVMAGAIYLFVTERLRVDVVALLVMTALVVSGVITLAEGLSGFSNQATVMVATMFVLSAALQRNGAVAEGDLDIANAKAMDPNIVKEFADYGVQ